jgi:hypothetical protein
MFGAMRLVREWLGDLRSQQTATLSLVQQLHQIVAAQQGELRVAEARHVADAQRLAALQASFEWLTSYVNRLEHERVLLLQRATGVTTGVPVLEQNPEAAATATAPEFGRGIPLSDDVGDAPSLERALTDLASLTFEDMGDEAAARVGLTHDAFGNLVGRGVS